MKNAFPFHPGSHAAPRSTALSQVAPHQGPGTPVLRSFRGSVRALRSSFYIFQEAHPPAFKNVSLEILPSRVRGAGGREARNKETPLLPTLPSASFLPDLQFADRLAGPITPTPPPVFRAQGHFSSPSSIDRRGTIEQNLHPLALIPATFKEKIKVLKLSLGFRPVPGWRAQPL